ncbi:MAG: hypothetical protein AAGI72_13905 [Pseudomonadota bacterium]
MRPLLSSFFILCVIGASCVLAAPEPHGKRYIAAQDWVEQAREEWEEWEEPASPNAPTASDEPLPGIDASPSPEAADGLRELRERVDAQELRYGPYAVELVETLGDLARLLDASGDSAAALGLRERALHLIRVNEGLYSPSQGPILRAILDSDRRRGDLEALDSRYAYFFRLYGAGRAPYSELRWAAAMEYFAWQREALLRRIDRDPRARLLELHATQEDLRGALIEDPSADWRYLRDISLSQLATLYLVDDMVDVQEFLYDPRTQRRRREDPLDFDPLRERVENLKRTLRGRGRDILEEALERIPFDEVQARAELRLELGDWQQWQGASRTAEDLYSQLWQDLGTAGLTALRASWFETPQPLPAAGVFVHPGIRADREIPCVLDVSERGRVRVSRCDGKRGADAERLRRNLQASRFRPAFTASGPVAVEGWGTTWRTITAE